MYYVLCCGATVHCAVPVLINGIVLVLWMIPLRSMRRFRSQPSLWGGKVVVPIPDLYQVPLLSKVGIPETMKISWFAQLE
jgi:hypothetical protein